MHRGRRRVVGRGCAECLRLGRMCDNCIMLLRVPPGAAGVALRALLDDPNRRRPLTEEELAQMPVVKMNARRLERCPTCSICLEELRRKADAVELDCRHCYHQECIANWFRQSNTCPLCVRRVDPGAEWTGQRPEEPDEEEEQPRQQMPIAQEDEVIDLTKEEDTGRNHRLQRVRGDEVIDLTREEAGRDQHRQPQQARVVEGNSVIDLTGDD